MRAAIFALLLFPMTTAICSAGPFGEKIVPGRNHDFGVVMPVELKHTFVLLNPYKVPVKVTAARGG